MSIGKCVSVFDKKTGEPTVLECGSWFCYDCNKLRKTINFPFTGTIDGRCKKCGCEMVYKQE